MFIHPCGSLKLFLGQVKSLDYCWFGFYFIDSDKIDCLEFSPQIWFWTYAPEGSYDNKRWFRTFVMHLRSLVENMTHFLNHSPFPKISLKLQCQEILGFSRQLISCSAHGLWSCFSLFWPLVFSEFNVPASNYNLFKALRHSCTKYVDSLLLAKHHFTLLYSSY